jgi:hypothetical protein
MASDARRFPGDGVFDRVARAVCVANCLPRKELFETWEAAVIIGEHFCAEVRSIHWSPYDRVGVVNADP